MKKKEECRKGAPSWMVTYGDMMTLLLTFFVLLLSFSTIEQVKFEAAIASIREGMGFWPENAGVLERIRADKAARNEQEAMEAQEVVSQLVKTMEELEITDAVELYHTPRGIRIIISDPLPFESGKADLRPAFRTLLMDVAKITRNTTFNEIRVEGHTDNVPIHTAKYPSNWELSAARALAATKFLAFRGGLNPANLSAVGYGEYRPRDTNSTSEGRAHNRRVEVYLERKKPSYEASLEQLR